MGKGKEGDGKGEGKGKRGKGKAGRQGERRERRRREGGKGRGEFYHAPLCPSLCPHTAPQSQKTGAAHDEKNCYLLLKKFLSVLTFNYCIFAK